MPSPSPLVNALFGLIFLVFLLGWTAALLRLKHGLEILPFEPRPVPPHPGFDTLLHGVTLGWVVFVFVVTSLILAQFISIPKDVEFAAMTPGQRVQLVQADMIVKMVALLAALPLVLLRYTGRWGDLGWQVRRAPYDLVIGFVGFCMLAVPVLIVQVVLSQLWPEKHPFIEVLLKNPDPQFLVIAGISAVILAPIAEEYFFRVLLQGLLERLSMRPGWQLLVEEPPPPSPPPGMLAGEEASPAADPVDHSLPPGAEALAEEAAGRAPGSPVPAAEEVAADAVSAEEELVSASLVEPENPFAAPHLSASKADAITQLASQPAYWPIIISSLIFALAHLGQGPAPVPLFLLALGLGYVYRATHRVLPCVVIHFCLNGFSMLQLWLMM